MTRIDAMFDELEKIAAAKVADVVFGPEGAPITAGGAFVGGGDMAHEEARERALALQELVSQHRSIQRARAAYQEAYPDDFTTTAFKREEAPGGLRFFASRMFTPKKAKSRQESYEERKESPRTFLRTGPPGGYHQDAFYREVARGLHDDELDQPWVPKKDRVVYQ